MAILLADVETKEALRRIKEISTTFGGHTPLPFCDQIKTYIESLFELEKTRKHFKGISPRRNDRNDMILFLQKVAEREKYTSNTLFSAVYLFDHFFDIHAISVNQISLVALVCLIIAGKMEEKDHSCPKITKLRRYLPPSGDFSFRLFLHIERYILQFYDFRILVPTEVTFLELYLLYALDGVRVVNSPENQKALVVYEGKEMGGKLYTSKMYSEDVMNNNVSTFARGFHQSQPNITSNTVHDIHNLCMMALETLMIHEPSPEYSPSLIAAAVLLHARREVGLNFWTHNLTRISTYNLRTVVVCLRYHVEPKICPGRSEKTLPRPGFIEFVGQIGFSH